MCSGAGRAAAIVRWIAVVGGARLWAQLDLIDVPAAHTVSALPRELLIAEGFRTLALPFLLAGAVALFVYVSSARTADLQDQVKDPDVKKTADAVPRARRASDEAYALADEAADALREAWCSAAAVAQEGPARDIAPQMRALDQATMRARECLTRSLIAARRAQYLTEQARSSPRRRASRARISPAPRKCSRRSPIGKSSAATRWTASAEKALAPRCHSARWQREARSRFSRTSREFATPSPSAPSTTQNAPLASGGSRRSPRPRR